MIHALYLLSYSIMLKIYFCYLFILIDDYIKELCYVKV